MDRYVETMRGIILDKLVDNVDGEYIKYHYDEDTMLLKACILTGDISCEDSITIDPHDYGCKLDDPDFNVNKIVSRLYIENRISNSIRLNRIGGFCRVRVPYSIMYNHELLDLDTLKCGKAALISEIIKMDYSDFRKILITPFFNGISDSNRTHGWDVQLVGNIHYISIEINIYEYDLMMLSRCLHIREANLYCYDMRGVYTG